MNTNILNDPPHNRFTEATKETVRNVTNSFQEAAQHATDAAREQVHRASEATRDTVHRAADATKDISHTMSEKAGDALENSREYVRKNPMPVVLGALALGAAVGYLIVMSRKQEPTFREKYVDDPLRSAVDTLYASLAPLGQRFHQGYDSARDGAGRAIDNLHRSQASDSWVNQLGRNLKLW